MATFSVRHCSFLVALAGIATVAALAGTCRPPDVKAPADPPATTASTFDRELLSIAEPPADLAALTDSDTAPAKECQAPPSPEPTPTAASVDVDLPPVASPIHIAFRILPPHSLSSEGTWGETLTRARPYPIERPPLRSVRDLEFELALAPEVALQPPHDRTRYFNDPPADSTVHPTLDLLDTRSDLNGLPALRGRACTLPPYEANRLRADSGLLRGTFASVADYVNQRGIGIYSPPEGLHRSRIRRERAGIRPDSVALMSQMLQCAEPPMRKYLIDQLRDRPGPEVGEALAKRALYELDPGLRLAAVRALGARPRDEGREVLLTGFRHPWPPIADHAAEALTALRDRAVIPALRELLDAPNPAGPVPDADGRPVMRQVVRINHARNCQLCHATSWNASDPVRVAVPSPDQPLPPSFSVVYYSESRDSAIVRADVTYLRQDFSWMLTVPEPGPWPAQQRYDFFVRSRPADPEEEGSAARRTSWPQRDAVRRALAQFAGERVGARAPI